jgi:vacuolar-type H+-ATPase subunit H
MSESNINIVLNAIDHYSGVLTGLNQGLELLGKGFGYVKSAAGFAFDTIGKGIELAKVGGAFQEQRAQFENLAASYKQSGQSIIDTVRETASYTVNEMDSIKVATKAMAAGLQGDNMKVALAYLKKWSEATGESFLAVSDRAFTALSSGKTALLNQMGLFIDKGDDLTEITAKMREGLKRFGDTGFNAADQFDALTAAQDDFWRKLGQGVNNSEGFQEILSGLTEAVIGFVRGFNPATATLFFDMLTDGAMTTYRVIAEAYPEISELLESLFNNPVKAASNLSRAAVDAFFAIRKAGSNLYNDLIDIFAVANFENWMSGTFNFAMKGISALGWGISSLAKLGVDAFTFLYDSYAEAVDKIVRSSPKIAKLLGFDSVDTGQIRKWGAEAQEGIGVLAESFKTGFADLFGNMDQTYGNMNEQLAEIKVSTEDIDKAHKDALASLKAIEDSYDTSTIKARGLGDATTALQEKINKLQQKAADKDNKAQDKAEKDAEDARKKAVKDIESAHERLDKLQQNAQKQLLTRAEQEAKAMVSAAEDKVSEIEKKLKKEGLDGKFSFELQVNQKALDEAKEKLATAQKNKIDFAASLDQKSIDEAVSSIDRTISSIKPATIRMDGEAAIKTADQAAAEIQKKFTGFGVALSPDALNALAKSMPVLKPKAELDIDTKDLDNIIKGKIETDINLKLSDKGKDSQLPPDSAILQWILQVVKNGLVSAASGEGLPLTVTT